MNSGGRVRSSFMRLSALVLVPLIAVGIALNASLLPANAEDAPVPAPTPTAPPMSDDNTTPSEGSDPAVDAPVSTEVPSPDAPSDSQAPQAPLATAPAAGTPMVTPFAEGEGPRCEPGYVYSVSSGGTVRQVDLDGKITELGKWAPNSTVNGLAIAANGTTVYAYDRSYSDSTGYWSQAQMLRYTPSTNKWEAIGEKKNTRQSMNLVTGAVNLQNGNYLFGGFDSSNLFQLWEFNTTTFGYTYKGSFATEKGGNGDMAFNAAGDLFVLASTDAGGVSIFTVTAANLNSASGGPIPRTQTKEFQLGENAVNGMAFDADGTIYLGTATTIYRYNPTTWVLINTITKKLTSSTDLASCNSPGTLAVKKNVVQRAAENDQFKMTLKNGSTEVASEVTTGSSTGVQPDQIGPVPAVTGDNYTFSEVMATGSASPLGAYTTTWACTGGAVPASGSGTSGTVTMPAPAAGSPGAAVECTFTNTPLSNDVTLTKTWKPGTPGDTAGLSINGSMVTSATTSTADGTNPQVDTVNKAVQPAAYGSTVTLNEAVTGSQYTAVYTCKQGDSTLPMTGSTFNMPAKSGAVTCVVTNTPKTPTSLTLNKEFDVQYGAPADSKAWTLTATLAGKTTNFEHGVKQLVPAGTYSIDEVQKPGYELKGILCSVDGGKSVEVPLDTKKFVLPTNQATVCTLRNKDLPGSVEWQKVDGATPANHLGGSEWKITGPAPAATEIPVIDCVEEEAADCAAGPDTDHRAGYLAVQKLAWGDYTLVETKAPVGFVLDGKLHRFMISVDARTVTLDPIVNAQQPVPTLPLTGGVGSDWFTAAGGVAALLALGLFAWRRRRSQVSL